MKKCSKCKEIKEDSEYSKDKSVKCGLRSNCRECTKGYNKSKEKEQLEYRVKNKQKLTQYTKQYESNNKEKTKLRQQHWYRENKTHRKNYYEANKQKILFNQKEYVALNKEHIKERKSNYRKNNVARDNTHSSYRRAAKRNATPKWLTKFDLQYIRHLFIQAKELEKLDGIKRHIDHIIPLRGKTVSGLHVPWNLQILTAEENHKKYNHLIEGY